MTERHRSGAAPIPVEWDEIDATWTTAALAATHPGVRVADVRVADRTDGSNRRARLEVSYAHGSGPRRIFLKAAEPTHRETYARLGHLFNESELFTASLGLGLEHPAVFHAVIDRPGLDYVVVMEDILERGADPRDATRPVSVAEAMDGIIGLSRMHSRYWAFTSESHPALAFVPTWAPHEGFQVGLRKFVPNGLTRAADKLPPEVAALTGDDIVDLWTRYVDSLSAGPVTLLHGDAHIGNTYVLPDGGVGFLDWEMVRRGNWSQDVGYYLVGALVEDDRRERERDLIGAYLASLDPALPGRPGADEAWLRYRAAAIYGLTIWLSTLGTDGWQRPDISATLVARYAAAYVDLGARDALDELGR